MDDEEPPSDYLCSGQEDDHHHQDNNNNNTNSNVGDDVAVDEDKAASSQGQWLQSSGFNPVASDDVPPASVEVIIDDLVHKRLGGYFNALLDLGIFSAMYPFYFRYDVRGSSSELGWANFGRLIQFRYLPECKTKNQPPRSSPMMSQRLMVLSEGLLERAVQLSVDVTDTERAGSLMSMSVAHFAQNLNIRKAEPFFKNVEHLRRVTDLTSAKYGGIEPAFLRAPLSIDIDLNDNDGVADVDDRGDRFFRSVNVNGDIEIKCDPTRARYCCSMGKEGTKTVCEYCWKIAVCHARLVTCVARAYHETLARGCKSDVDSFVAALSNQTDEDAAPSSTGIARAENSADIEFDYCFSGGRGIHIFCRSHLFEMCRVPGSGFASQLHELLSVEVFAEQTVRNNFPVTLQLFDDLYEILFASFNTVFCERKVQYQPTVSEDEFAEAARSLNPMNRFAFDDGTRFYTRQSREYVSERTSKVLRNSIFGNPYVAATFVAHVEDASAALCTTWGVKKNGIGGGGGGGETREDCLAEFIKSVADLKTLGPGLVVKEEAWDNILQCQHQCHYRRLLFYVMVKMLHPRLDKNVSGGLRTSCALPVMMHKSITMCYPFVGASEDELFKNMDEFGFRFEIDCLMDQLKLYNLVGDDGTLNEECAKILKNYKEHLNRKFAKSV